MRVCVYEGWKSLQKGLEKQRAAYNTARTKSQKRNNEEFRKETVRKYARLNGGRRVKVEIESDSAYSEQDEEEDSLDSDFVEESSLERTRRLFVDYVRAHDVVVTTY
jgi:E3 ubiquitin-protein ligase SHPRH